MVGPLRVDQPEHHGRLRSSSRAKKANLASHYCGHSHASPPGFTTRLGVPLRVVINSIGVKAGVARLGLNRDRTLAVPLDFNKAGWWSGGSVPGEQGPA